MFQTQCPFTLIPKSAHGHSHTTQHKKEFNRRVVGVESLKQLGFEYLTSAHSCVLKTQLCENMARTLSNNLEVMHASQGPPNYASFENFIREPLWMSG